MERQFSQKEELIGEEKFRLSVKGALRETGRHSMFHFSEPDPASQTGRLERQRLLIEQIENVDFYIEQGFFDVALSALESLEKDYPEHPMILDRLEKLALLEKEGKVKAVPSLIMKSEVSQVPQRDGNEAEIFFNPAEVVSEEEEHITEEENKLEQEQLVDIAEVDFRTTQSFENSLTPRRFKTLQETRSLFEELQEELDEQPTEDSFHEHFNVALVYLEMELIDDAIEEFQTAFKLVEPTSSSAYKCCMQLGRCFVMKEMPRAALIWFKRAADIAGLDRESYAAAYYAQARIYEEMGEREVALKVYQKVEVYVQNYEDVAERMFNLKVALGS